VDNLTIALCICIGTGVPWLIAIHSENGARQLIGNSVALAFDWISPTYSIIALISAGPVVALLTITAGQAVKRAIVSKLSQPPY
jgi:hypothetical protein